MVLVNLAQGFAKVPVIHVDAANRAPLDIGLEIGLQSKQLFPDIEQRYDSYLASSLSQMGFDDMLRDRMPGLRSTLDETYRKELEGVASAWSLVHQSKLGDGHLSWDEYWLLNLLPDIGLPANGVGFAVFSQVSKEKSALVGRNLNLKSSPTLRSLQAITVYQYADSAVVNIGFAGIVSVLSGFNESGLFIAHFNAAPDSSYTNPYPVKSGAKQAVTAQGFILRKALEDLTTTRTAIKYIAQNADGISSNTLVADKKNTQVLEYASSGKSAIRRWDSQTRPGKRWDRRTQIAVVDCHVLNSMPDNCRRAKDGFRWERLRSLAVFESVQKATTQDMAAIMLDERNQYYEMLAANTLQSMIFLPGTGHLYLYNAPVEAGSSPPAYQVYYEDLIPEELRKPRNNNFYLWVSVVLGILLITLWWTRRSIKKSDQQSRKLFDYGTAD